MYNIRVSNSLDPGQAQHYANSLDPDQARHVFGSDLGPNCLQRLSADDTSVHTCISTRTDNNGFVLII